MKNRRIFYSIFILTLFAGCFTPNQISVFDLSYLYDSEDNFTRLKYQVYHTSDSVSVAFLSVNLSDFSYERPSYGGSYQARYQISYKLMESYEGKTVLDSATYRFSDSVNFGKEVELIHNLEIPVRYGMNYVLAIELKDDFKLEGIKDFIPIYKANLNGQQNFMALTRDRKPLFKNYTRKDEQFRIKVNDNSLSRIYVRAYFRDFPVARPPFVQDKNKPFDYQADSTFTLELFNGESSYVNLTRPGFYHFQKDTNSKQGYTLYHFYDGFPALTEPDHLLEPLRYISTKNEYEKILSSPDRKAGVDEFWLNSAGNELRARTLIQKFYGGVQEANQYYTSYHEGWKTDRGLIYVIYGKPDVVYRGPGQEEWIYGEPEHRNSLRFTFVQVQNPFSYNDFMLLRSPTLKDSWYMTVQGWRR